MIDLRVVTESEVFVKQSNDALELTGFEIVFDLLAPIEYICEGV